MKAYIVHDSPLGTDYWGEGMYALITEKEETVYKRWCSNRAFAIHDLTKGVEKILQDHGITDVLAPPIHVHLCFRCYLLTYCLHLHQFYRVISYQPAYQDCLQLHHLLSIP